jgi:hypothetical protein
MDNIVRTLLERIPSFKRWRAVDYDDLPYVVFGEFGSFLQEMIEREPMSDDVLKESFALLNEMAETSDGEVINVLAEVFMRNKRTKRSPDRCSRGKREYCSINLIRFGGVRVHNRPSGDTEGPRSKSMSLPPVDLFERFVSTADTRRGECEGNTNP